MVIELTGRNVQVTDALRALALERTQKLERHLGGPADVRVVLSQEKHRFGAEVIATHRRRRWKAQEETADPRAAMALAFEKIDAQAKKDVEKRRDRKHRAAASLPLVPKRTVAAASISVPAAPPAAADGRIIRGGQRLPVKPMTAEEAAMRIDGSKQEFLVFRDSTSDRISILYKRRDGNFGLIVPEC